MRYLVLTELFLPTKGGTAVWFDEVYRRLGDRDTHIVTEAVPGSDEHDYQCPNTVHRISLPIYSWLRPESLIKYTKFFLVSVWLGVRHRFDAVHAGRVLPEGLVALLVGWIIRRPVVVYAHGEEITTWARHRKRRVAMQFTYRNAAVVIANSEFTKSQLEGLGVAPRKIQIVHPGADVERFHPEYEVDDLKAGLGVRHEDTLLVSVGRLSRRKGFDQVIRALPGLVAQGFNTHLAIIGIGEDHDHLVSLARDEGVSDRVHFLGHVAARDLPRWYVAADIFVMPNRDIAGDTEGFGMVFVEAGACGTPVIAGQSGGTAASVVDGVTGLRIDGESEEAVHDAIVSLLKDPRRAREMGNAGRRRAVEELSWEHVAACTQALGVGLSR